MPPPVPLPPPPPLPPPHPSPPPPIPPPPSPPLPPTPPSPPLPPPPSPPPPSPPSAAPSTSPCQPLTASPTTTAGVTSAPTRAACAEAPPEALPVDVVNPFADTQKSIIAATVAFGSFTNPGLPTLALLAEDLCDQHGQAVGVALHPLRFSVSGSQHVGCVVGNGAIFAVFLIVHRAACLIAKRLSSGIRSAEQVMANFQMPGLLFIAVLFLYQGVTFSSLRLVANAGDESQSVYIVVGAAGIVGLCLSAPGVLWLVVLQHARAERVDLDQWKDPSGCTDNAVFANVRTTKLRAFMIGDGEWCSLKRDMWLQRNGALLRMYRPPHHRAAVIFQVLKTALIGLLRAVPWKRCGMDMLFVSGVLLLHGAWCLWRRPYARDRDTLYEAITTLLAFGAMVAKGLALLSNDDEHRGFSVSSELLIAVLAVSVVKIVLDLLSFLYLLYNRRRTLTQDRVFLAVTESALTMGSPFSPVSLESLSPINMCRDNTSDSLPAKGKLDTPSTVQLAGRSSRRLLGTAGLELIDQVRSKRRATFGLARADGRAGEGRHPLRATEQGGGTPNTLPTLRRVDSLESSGDGAAKPVRNATSALLRSTLPGSSVSRLPQAASCLLPQSAGAERRVNGPMLPVTSAQLRVGRPQLRFCLPPHTQSAKTSENLSTLL
eukprot:TRINITY_DN7009_c1_g1_i2.p1 TRINITY_DN7009_c1_g1~~TRINITY_DN7009_c1_g1_i2.p1  ORF type:complete len:689 (+),score=120.28 TRINITY_DN7009_c1_g1_i2:91-2067(+)